MAEREIELKMNYRDIIIKVILTLAIGYAGLYFYGQEAAKRRIADAASPSLKYVPRGIMNMQTGQVETLFYKVPCPEGFDCAKIIPRSLREKMDSDVKEGRKYSVEYVHCQGEECMEDVGEFLKTYGVKTKVSRYLKNKK